MKKKLFIGLGIIVAILMIIGIFSGGNDTKVPLSVGGSAANVEIVGSNETLDESGLRTVHVEVRNNSDKLLSTVVLKTVYYDENQKVVGTGNGSASNIPAHTSKIVDCLAMDIQNLKTYKVQVEGSMFE